MRPIPTEEEILRCVDRLRVADRWMVPIYDPDAELLIFKHVRAYQPAAIVGDGVKEHKVYPHATALFEDYKEERGNVVLAAYEAFKNGHGPVELMPWGEDDQD